MPGLYLVYPVLIPYCAWFIPCLIHTYPFLSKLSMPAGHCAHCAPVSFCLGRPLRGPSQGALGCQPQAVFHLSLETHGRTAAKSPSHLLVLQGRYPSRAGILQHLLKTGPARFWSYGRAECADVLRAHTNTHPLRGPSRQCAGSRAVDALVFSMATLHRLTSTSSESISAADSHTAARTQPRSRAGWEATSMR
jgi:hypothetical protein